MLVYGDEVDPDGRLFRGVAEEVQSGVNEPEEGALPCVRDEELRLGYVGRIDQVRTVGQALRPGHALVLDPLVNDHLRRDVVKACR